MELKYFSMPFYSAIPLNYAKSLSYKRKIPEILFRLGEKYFKDPCSRFYFRFQLWCWKATVGQNLQVSGRVRLRSLGNLSIGNRVRILSGYANYVGASDPTAIYVCRGGEIQIENDCGLSNVTIVCRKRIDILEGTFIGGGSRIYDNDFHQMDPQNRLSNQGVISSESVCIGPRAFVGGHCIVLKGVTIGEGAIIGAGSVVTRDVPAFEIWAGVPAKKIGDL
jgi:acetyltransferase-like isoleucine patch superfamily enzyme